VIIIHVCDKYDSREFIFFTQIPCFFCTNFDPCLAVYNNDRCVSGADSLFHFTNEIEVTRGIKKVDLDLSFCSLVLDRNHCSGDRELPLDLFFIIVTDRISVSNLAHSLCNAGQISQCLGYRRLTGAAVP